MRVQGVFVFDCVVHASNMSDANLLDRSDAQQGRDSIVGLGAQTRAPANQDLYPTFAKDWNLEPGYAAAKGGVISLTRYLSRDCTRYGVRVKCVMVTGGP